MATNIDDLELDRILERLEDQAKRIEAQVAQIEAWIRSEDPPPKSSGENVTDLATYLKEKVARAKGEVDA